MIKKTRERIDASKKKVAAVRAKPAEARARAAAMQEKLRIARGLQLPKMSAEDLEALAMVAEGRNISYAVRFPSGMKVPKAKVRVWVDLYRKAMAEDAAS